jgi:hypothetical protein
MDNTGKLNISFKDLYGNSAVGNVKVTVRLGDQVIATTALEARKVVAITSLLPNDYTVDISPEDYENISTLVKIKSNTVKILPVTMAFKTDKLSSITFPAYNQLATSLQTVLNAPNTDVKMFVKGVETKLSGLSGQALYDRLENIPKAGLLNLYTKMEINGRSVFSYVKSLTEIHGDRIFVNVDKNLYPIVQGAEQAGMFEKVSEALHTPPEGFDRSDSFKSFDKHGNLQLSFFNKNMQEFIVDADIDEARGIAHIFEVIRNMGSRETDPLDIHQILLAEQHLDTGYRLVV